MSGENIDVNQNLEFVQPTTKPRLSENAGTPALSTLTRPSIYKIDNGRGSLTGQDNLDPFSRGFQMSSKKIIIEQGLVIKLRSSWSNSKISGLSRIIFMDCQGNKLNVCSDWVACKNCGLTAPKNVHKLIGPPDGSNKEEDWGCVLSAEGSELIFDLRKCKTVHLVRIYNLRERNQGQNYGGIKDISIVLNGEIVFTGELKRPLDGQSNQDLVTDIFIKQDSSDPKDSHNYLSKLRANGTYAPRIYSKTHNFSATQNLPSRESTFEPKITSPRATHTQDDVRKSSNNLIIKSNYNLSDEDSQKPEGRDSNWSKPEERVESSSNLIPTNQMSEEQSERGEPTRRTGRTMTHHERSISKASRDSQDSKLRKHPQIANSSAKYIFTADLVSKPRPSGGTGSVSRPKVNPVTPGRVFTLEDKVGTSKRDFPVSRDPSQESNKPVRIRKRLLSTQSSNEMSSPQLTCRLKGAFKELVEQNASFKIPNLPLGKTLQLSLYTNWGDTDHIGLHGIELYDVSGIQIEFNYPEKSITRTDISSKELNDDPMMLKKLISDSLVMGNPDLYWTTKMTGKCIKLKIKLPSQTRLSLIRIWNVGCQKSQVNSGIRDIVIHLDDKLIFLGEIAKCTGDRGAYFDEAEYITFTSNKTILQNIEQNDWIRGQDVKLGLLEKGKSIENLSSSPYSEDMSPSLGKDRGSEVLDGIHYESRLSSPNSRTNLSRKCTSKESFNFLELTMKAQSKHVKSNSNLLKLVATDESPTHGTSVEVLDIKVLQSWSQSTRFGVQAIELYGKESLTRQQR